MIAAYASTLLTVSLRAAAFYKDDRRPARTLLVLATIWSIATIACFQIDRACLLVLAACILPNAIVPIATERCKSRIVWRLLLLSVVVVPFILPAELLPRPRTAWHALSRWMETVPSGSGLVAKVSMPFVFAHLTGLLLCLSDCNLILRSMLRLLGINPPTPQPSAAETALPDAAQYLRGGLVGAIERLLIYIFAANGAFNAIAFVITVKGVVRYQEIVKNQSAEYILVGTMLSTLMAMLLGMLFVRLV